MGEFRLRTVGSWADERTQWWPRWAPLIVWIISCAVLSAALVHLTPVVYGPQVHDELVQLFRLAPLLAVAVLFVVFRDPNRRPRLVLFGGWSWRLLLATGIALLTGAVVVVITLAARDTFLGIRTALPVLGVPLLVTIAAALVTALCEEVAWRAWLQPELEEWWGPLPSAVAVGFTWGLWYALIRRPDVEHAAAFGLATMGLSVAIRAILRAAPGQNLVVATACHAALNVGMLTVLPGRGEAPITLWSLAVASWLVAIALWLASAFRPVREGLAGDDDLAELDDLPDGIVDDGFAGPDLREPSALELIEPGSSPDGAVDPDADVEVDPETDDPWAWIAPDRPDADFYEYDDVEAADDTEPDPGGGPAEEPVDQRPRD